MLSNTDWFLPLIFYSHRTNHEHPAPRIPFYFRLARYSNAMETVVF